MKHGFSIGTKLQWLLCLLLAWCVACKADHSDGGVRKPGSPGDGTSMTEDAGPGITGGVECVDQDGDGISDRAEGEADADADADGTPNAMDTDSDGDGLADLAERGAVACALPPDLDGDGKPNFLDDDSDGDGIPDLGADAMLDTDGDFTPDFADLDDDGDGLPDADELGADPLHPLDSDGDGTPDFRDVDSDGDGVLDFTANPESDIDQDGTPDYLDDDVDGDGIDDVIELGSNAAEPRDGDEDGTPDYVDADSDNDGLADGLEDRNGDGKLDTGESNAREADTDDDGADDLVESAAGTDPDDETDNPAADGNFVFVVPFEEDPEPEKGTLDFTTDVVRADLVFSVDTTGSMGDELTQLQADLSSEIIPALADEIPDLAFAVVGFQDFPLSPFGDPGDLPYELFTPITTDAADAQAGVGMLTIGSGGDGPESGIEALHQIATGNGVSWTGGSIPDDSIGFRDGALPIVIQISDAPNNDASLYGATVPDAAERDATLDELDELGARVIAVVSGEGVPGAADDYLNIVEETGAVVPTDAFGSSGDCLTGLGGDPVDPNDDDQCPLLFNIDGAGAGLGTSIVDAVVALSKYAGLDIDARPENERGNVDAEGEDVNAVRAFLDRVVPSTRPSASTMCVGGLDTADRLEDDDIDDTFVDVQPGTKVCFDVIAKMNETVEPAAYPQLFRARIEVYGDDVTLLDTRQVWFVVPPKPPEPGNPCGGLDVDCADGGIPRPDVQ